MKTRNVLIALAAVAMFALPAMAQISPGDECADPQLPGSPVDSCAATANVTDPGQGAGAGCCTNCWASGDGDDRSAWYIFVATDTNMRVRTDLNSAQTDSHIAVYSGDCSVLPGSLTEIACQEDAGGAAGYNNDLCASGLTIGDTYWVQLGNWAAGACGVYQVDVSDNFVLCGNDTIDSPCEQCDGTDASSCSGLCTAKCTCPDPICGNNVNESGEQCDGTDDTACPGNCFAPGAPLECLCSAVCGNGIKEGGEQCDGEDALACKGPCQDDCTCAPFCGDGTVDPGEDCDPPGGSSCPANGVCLANCTCGPSRPALPGWGLVGLGLVLLAGVMIVFGRRRTVAGI